jgi:hypothetical protein
VVVVLDVDVESSMFSSRFKVRNYHIM